MTNIPTLAETFSSVIATLETKYGDTISLTGKVFLRAYAGVLAANIHLLYLAVGDVQKNVWPDLADTEAQGGTLERFGRVKLDRNPTTATAAFYNIQLTTPVGAPTTGTVVPENTIFKSDDDSLNPGKLYSLDTEFTLEGTNIIEVRALVPGIDSKLSVADTLTATAPIALVDQVATVVTEEQAPLAAETIEAYRAEIIQAFRLAPQGGSGSDYRIWAAEVSGVQQSYPFAKAGNVNEVDLFIEATEVDSTDGNGTPTSDIIDNVESAVEDPTADRPSRKPLTVFEVNFLAVTPLAIEIDIAGFVGITTAKDDAITNAITEDLKTVRPFVGSIDILSAKNDIFDKNRIVSLILEAVPGSVFGAIILKVNTVSVETFTFENGDIPFFENLDFS